MTKAVTGGKALRVKGPKDLTARVIAKIKAGRPRDGEGSKDCTFEVSRSSEAILSKVRYVLSTGIEAYDLATGIGGLPFGRVVEIYGLDGAAKSAMAIRCAIRMQQRQIFERVKRAGSDDNGGDPVFDLVPVKDDVPVFTIYVDNEQSIDEDGKTKVDGIELDVAVARCDTIDQMFKIMDTAIDGVAEVEKETGTECFIAVIVDTIAGTSSREEVKAKWEDVDYPRQPRQLREGFRVMMRKISRRNVLAIFTNQVSEKYQKSTGQRGRSPIPQDDDFSTFGGRALKFFASMRIFHTQVNAQYKLNRLARFPHGRSIQFTMTKNRLGKPWRSGRMVLLYEGGLNNIFSKLETLVLLKLAERGEKGDVKFRFKSAGVITTTFEQEPGERGLPGIDSTDQWPAFYEAHKADFDELWNRAREIMFVERGNQPEDPDDDDVSSDVDVDEETD